MTEQTFSKAIQSPDDMAELARTIATGLSPGDCLLLNGVIGAGKSHFARSLIECLLTTPEDIPSPTFTLVQTYDGPDCEIWHSDLYRLTDLDEIFELGLVDAFEHEITLVEWPEKLEDVAPAHALKIDFRLCPDSENARDLEFKWQDAKWTSLMERLSYD